MAKRSRRGRSERAGRSTSAVARQRARQRQAEVAVRRERMARLVAALFDAETPIDIVVATMVESYRSTVPPGIAQTLAQTRGVADLLAIAAALADHDRTAGEGSSLRSLTFEAHVAGLLGDLGRARALMDRAMAAAGGEHEFEFITHLVAMGRVADALERLVEGGFIVPVEPAGGGVVEPPGGVDAVGVYRDALQQAHARVTGVDEPGECPCGSGLPWRSCCRAREEAVLAAFADRSGVYELRSAVVAHMDATAYGPAIERHVVEWLRRAEATERSAPEVEALSRLAYEHAWIVAGLDDDSDDEHDNVLTSLARHPATRADIAARARAWRDGSQYGLWLVLDPVPAPGITCIDILSGLEVYVAIAPEQAEGLPRWSVLLAALVPVDGAWRTTGTFVRASPAEGDQLHERVQSLAETLMDVPGARRRRPAGRHRSMPHNVLACIGDQPRAELVHLLTGIVGGALPHLLADLHRWRSTPPSLTNTDGDPLTLIRARVRVADPAVLRATLERHSDFEAAEEADQPRAWNWLGKAMPAAQRRAAIAQLRAQLAAEGRSDVEVDESDFPGRWVRAKLRIDGDEILVEANSQRRLDGVMRILTGAGLQPFLLDETRIDPVQDLPWQPGYRPFAGIGPEAPAGEGWERAWLEERVPALGGLTPLDAAEDEQARLVLEGLLRQFEYDSDVAGRSGADLAWLREQLEMPAEDLA